MDFSTSEITSKKVRGNDVDFSSNRKKYVETTQNFQSAKLHRKSMWKRRGFFDHRNYIEKSTWKQRRFFDQRNYVEKSTWKRRGFFDQSKLYQKSTRKWRGNSSKFGLRRIGLISTSNPRWFDVVFQALKLFSTDFSSRIFIFPPIRLY